MKHPTEGLPDGSAFALMGTNARLISAAPAMLDALEEIFAYADGNQFDDDGQILDNIADEARAAIAKAKG